ncbi:nuclear receptor-binding factor 2 isoform X2 [Ambystoma mexicanum]|uniref:nuclear receptor-binding factor 2 isoform X2 n=1 Tax=Ambystoma mexicanum TaxID=8296 RepID=UPI0037E7163B
MEVMESPLNVAHQQSRKADRLLSTGKYEEAISCHKLAAVYLAEAMKQTPSEQAQLSLALQRDTHMKQQLLIQERWKLSKREERLRIEKNATLVESDIPAHFQVSYKSPGEESDGHVLVSVVHKLNPTRVACFQKCQVMPDREPDSLLYLLQKRKATLEMCVTNKAPKDDKIKLEEQQTKIVELNQLISLLLAENERLTQENKQLKEGNSRLQQPPLERESDKEADFVEKSELWDLQQPCENITRTASTWKKCGADYRKTKLLPIPSLTSLDIPLPDLPPLELPDDVETELKGLMDK